MNLAKHLEKIFTTYFTNIIEKEEQPNRLLFNKFFTIQRLLIECKCNSEAVIFCVVVIVCTEVNTHVL